MTTETSATTRLSRRICARRFCGRVASMSLVFLLAVGVSIDSFATNHISQNLVDDRSSRTGSSGRQDAANALSLDEATSIVQQQHPGSRIVKVVRQKRADGRLVAKFRILTKDGRMKNISLPLN